MRYIFERNDRVIVCNEKLKTFNMEGTIVNIGTVDFLSNQYTFGVKLDDDDRIRYYNEKSLKLTLQSNPPIVVPEVKAVIPESPRAGVRSYDDVKGNYYNADIVDGCDVSNLDLSNQLLTYETLYNVNFDGCIMPDVSCTEFINCSFVGATFICGNATRMYDCNMAGAIFTLGNYDNSIFWDCILRGAIFNGSFCDSSFSGCDMKYASSIDKLNVWGVSVERPKEENPVINIHSNFESYIVVFMGNHIQIGCQGFTRHEWENFTDSVIRLFDGRYALTWWHNNKEEIFKLHDEYLAQFETNASGTDLGVSQHKRIKYKGEVRSGGNYSNMDLSENPMSNEVLSNCKFNNSILPNVSHTIFSECEMVGAVFSGNAVYSEFSFCILRDAVFHYKDFEDSTFSACDMRRATLAGNFRDAMFSNCNLDGAKLSEEQCDSYDYETSFRGTNVLFPVETVPVLTQRVRISNGTNDYGVSFFRNHIQIGCQGYTRQEWENFTSERIRDMDFGALAWWNSKKETIFKMHDEYLAKHNL